MNLIVNYNGVSQERDKMKPSFEHYSQLAGLFYYPESGYSETVKNVQAFLDLQYPEAGAELEVFTNFVSNASQLELEELFTRSFDVQAITTLDLGYVLFGDDYKRGAVLVNLNREHREVGIECNSELADHLPNILRLLHKMRKPELRAELVDKIIAPAIRKIISEFNPEKIDRKNAIYKKHHRTLIERSENYGTIYQQPLKALYQVLESDFEIKEVEMPRQSAGFLKSVGAEMSIES